MFKVYPGIAAVLFRERIVRFYFGNSWKPFSGLWTNKSYLLPLKKYYSYAIMRIVL